MKKRTISKLKSIFGSKSKAKRRASKCSRTPSPEPTHNVCVTPLNGDVFRPIARTPPTNRVGPPPSPPVPTSPTAPVAPEPAGPLPLLPCAVCGRTFVQQSLAKHVKICEKMTVKKRKTFDSSRQRREGTDLEQYLPKNFGLPENSPFLEKSPPPTAKPLPRHKTQSVRSVVKKPTAELQKCPHCSRAFGVRAFERHVEWCADKAKILPSAPPQPPAHLADAKHRLNARTQYKAPPVRGRRSSQSRDKSSNSRSASVESSRGVSPPSHPSHPAPLSPLSPLSHVPPRDRDRDCGDYRRARARPSVSESISSNECNDDTTPHIPVIKTTRTQQSSGDAVKARQARLARDLSNTRLDDAYDPFLSAARQMKELMSSDTNIPNKLLSTKDSNRTLPILHPTKEKSPPICTRSDTSKSMKEALNKSYQKTPTLQRMKSFGSSHNDNNNVLGSRCSSFRLNRNEKKTSPKLNTTFTKSSKENIVTADKISFNRNSSLNRSFSSYTTSSYSTPKPRDKIPKISTSLYHSFQRTTIKQPVKLDKIKRDDNKHTKKDFVNLDSILADDSSSLTDSNYIDPRLINEHDNLPINVNTILNNPDIVSSMDSLITAEHLPTKFDSFNCHNKYFDSNNVNSNHLENSNKIHPPTMDDLSAQYDKIMSSLEQSIASKASVRDDNSLCEDFDLEEFISSFDDELNKQKLSENKRTCSSTTRIVKHATNHIDGSISPDTASYSSSPKVVNRVDISLIPINKSHSLTFSNSNKVGESLFPSSMKRSNSNLLESFQKKHGDSCRNNLKADQLEQDIMQSLKDFDKFYETEKVDNTKKTFVNNNIKVESRMKREKKVKKYNNEDAINGNHTPNGKQSNDSAYSSLNRISPSKLSICTSNPSNGISSLEQIPAESDSGGSHRDNELQSVSSEEFLAMERSAELDAPLRRDSQERLTSFVKEVETYKSQEKRSSSRASSRLSASRAARAPLSSSGSEGSLRAIPSPAPAAAPSPSPCPSVPAPPRLSRFCHECGSRYPLDTAKFCIECGIKRLLV